MTIDDKYREMIEKTALAVDAFPADETELTRLLRNLLPRPDEDFERSMRSLTHLKTTDEQKNALSELNYAYMAFVSECKKSFSRDELGKIINLTMAVHGFVGLFMDREGNWR